VSVVKDKRGKKKGGVERNTRLGIAECFIRKKGGAVGNARPKGRMNGGQKGEGEKVAKIKQAGNKQAVSADLEKIATEVIQEKLGKDTGAEVTGEKPEGKQYKNCTTRGKYDSFHSISGGEEDKKKADRLVRISEESCNFKLKGPIEITQDQKAQRAWKLGRTYEFGGEHVEAKSHPEWANSARQESNKTKVIMKIYYLLAEGEKKKKEKRMVNASALTNPGRGTRGVKDWW